MIADWIYAGECRKPGRNPNWWWAEVDEPETSEALLLCWQCPVREPCLAHAIHFPETDGVWGGMLPSERRRIRALERERHAGRGVMRHARPHLEDTPEQIAARRQALLEATS